jgi:hypothetical protein
MENWLGLFGLMVFGAVFNLLVAFMVLRALAGAAGIQPDVNTPQRAMLSLLTILPVAGVAGAPFFLIPFIGPPFGIFVSACVAPYLFAERYSVTQGIAAKVILPTVAVVYVLSAVILYFGLPRVL